MDKQWGGKLVQDDPGRRVECQLAFLHGWELHLLCHLRYCDWVSIDILVKSDALGTVHLEYEVTVVTVLLLIHFLSF